MKTPHKIRRRLEYLRCELRNERISYGELIELQSLKDFIKEGDVELLEAAGVPEKIHINELPKQCATNVGSNLFLYEHPETGEYVWKEDLPDYIIE